MASFKEAPTAPERASYEPNYAALLEVNPYEDLSTEQHEGEEGESPEEMERKMQESMELNRKLKEMLAHQASLEQQRQQQQRSLAGARAPQSRTAVGGRQLGAPRPKNGGWGGVTHTDQRAREIDRANFHLVEKLSLVQERRRPLVDGPPVVRQASGSAAVNRRRRELEIERANAALMKRLGSVKPSKGLSTQETSKHQRQHQKNLSVLKGPERPSQPNLAPPRHPPSRGASRSGRPQPVPQLLRGSGPAYGEPAPFTF